MSRNDPGNPDILREWGLVLLKDPSRPEAERRAGAARVLAKTPRRQAEWTRPRPCRSPICRGGRDWRTRRSRSTKRRSPWRRTRRNIGNISANIIIFCTETPRPWRPGAPSPPARIATRRTWRDWARSSPDSGSKTEAAGAFADAIALDPRSFELRIKLADLKIEAGDHDAAENPAFRRGGPGRRRGAAKRLPSLAGSPMTGRRDGFRPRVEALKKRRRRPRDSRCRDPGRRLALYAEAARQPVEAISAIEDAIRLDGASVASWSTAARLFETNGRLADASAAFRKLAGIDRRGRAEALGGVARLEARLGRKDEALRAGRELLAAAPDNPDQVRVFAELCSQIGAVDEGLEALRRVARANESDPGLLRDLGDALAPRVPDRRGDRGRLAGVRPGEGYRHQARPGLPPGPTSTSAATRSTSSSPDLNASAARTAATARGRSASPRAYAASGDLGASRQQLESLLAADPRDVGLLQQLSELAEGRETTSPMRFATRSSSSTLPRPTRPIRVPIDPACPPSRRHRRGRGRLVAVGRVAKRPRPGPSRPRRPARRRQARDRPRRHRPVARQAPPATGRSSFAKRMRSLPSTAPPTPLGDFGRFWPSVATTTRKAKFPAPSAAPRRRRSPGRARRRCRGCRRGTTSSIASGPWRASAAGPGLEGGVPFASTFRINPTDFGEARMAALAGLAMLARREENEGQMAG